MKRISIYIISMLMSINALAQWVKPELPFVEPKADGTSYFLYNVEADAFVINGADWNTRACVSPDNALLVTLEQTANGYIIYNDYTLSNKCAFDCDDGNNSWVDGYFRRGYDTWHLTSIGGNKYELTNSCAEGLKWGALKDYSSDSRTYFTSDTQLYGTSWAFVSNTFNIGEYTRYLEAVKLGNELARVKKEYPSLDVAQVENVYKNTASTLEELRRASLLLDNLIKYADDPDNPMRFVINASFERGFYGWTDANGNTPIGYVGGLYAFPAVEVYENKVDVQQTVTGIPDGIYIASVQAFERPAASGQYDGTEKSKVSLFLNDYITPVQNIMSDAMSAADAKDHENCYLSLTDEEYFGDYPHPDYFDVETSAGYVPHGMVGASYAFRAGRYVQQTYGIVEGGTLKIGLTSNDDKIHWVLWSNFNLKYKGKDIESIKEVINVVNNRVNTHKSANDNTQPVLDRITQLQNDAAIASFSGDMNKAWNSLLAYNRGYNDLVENTAAIARLRLMKDDLKAHYDAAEGVRPAIVEVFNALIQRYESYKTLTTSEIDVLINDMASLVSILNIPNYNGASDDNPIDFTNVIYNNSAQLGNTNGWDMYCDFVQNLMYQSSAYSGGDYYVNGFLEAWVSSMLGDGCIRQTVKDIPAGKYQLEADFIATHQNYPNDVVHGVRMFASENDTESYVDVSTTNPSHDEGGAVGHFTLTFNKLSADSPLTLGVKWANTNANWVVCDNWQLTYYGEGLQDKLKSLISDVNAYIKNDMNDENGYAKTVLQIASEDAQYVLDNSTGNYDLREAYDALSQSYIDAMAYMEMVAAAKLNSTSVEALRTLGIISAQYYSVSGTPINKPVKGVNVLVMKRMDGSTITRKVMNK